MLIFGDRYNLIRDTYIYPLLSYEVKNNKLDYNNLKYILANKIKGIKSINGRNYEIIFNRDDLLKAIAGEADYFYTRSFVQYCNVFNSKEKFSPCWNVVTQYYFSFFVVNALLRFVHRGNTYLNSLEAESLSQILTVLNEDLIKVDQGNYVFNVVEYDDSTDLCLKLMKTSKGTHEQTWFTLEEFLDELLIDKKKDDEYNFLIQIKSILHTYKSNFPSMLRNEINYKPHYGYKSIKNEIVCNIPKLELDYIVKELYKFSPLSNNENYKIKISGLFATFLFIYSTKLLNEYISRGKYPKSSQKLRNEYLDKSTIEISNFPDAI